MPASDPEISTLSSSDSIPSVKDLASSDPSLRRQNLSTLLDHLSARSPDSTLDLTQCLQLWRGFSVALYMHDSKNMLSVQKLISTLASTVQLMYDKDVTAQTETKDESRPTVKESWSWLSAWTSAFWETLCREWSGIDQWRMNKYLLLIRFFIRALFQIIFQHQLDPEIKHESTLLQSQISILEKWPLSPRERKVPDGLRLHVLDVWMEELERGREAAETTAEGDEVEDAAETAAQSTPKKRKRKSHDDDGGRSREKAKKQKQNESATKPSLTVDEIVTKLIVPVRTLAKEAIGKGVKMKARDIMKEVDTVIADE